MNLRRSIFSLLILAVSLFSSAPALAQSCPEYFTNVWGNRLDMSGPEDILYNIVPVESNQLEPYTYSGGVFTTRVNRSLNPTQNPAEIIAWFQLLQPVVAGAIADDNTTRYGNRRPIDTNLYRWLKIGLTTDRPSFLRVLWEKPDSSLAVTDGINISAGRQDLQINLAGVPLVIAQGPTAAWTQSPAVGLRVYPSNADGALVQIDYIELATANNATCPLGRRAIAPFVQPDNEGGDDYFSTIRGNPSNFDSPRDLDFVGGVDDAFVHPGDQYTDSAGVVRTGDYFQAKNKPGNRDPVSMSVFDEKMRPIDPARFKIACWTMDVLGPVTQLKTVTRVLWQRDGRSVNGDDIVVRTNGESRYCVRMDTLPLEPPLAPGAPHPWSNNSNGTGIDFWRVDAHEIDVATIFRLNDVRLASDHEADKRFAVVLGGDRDLPVTVFYDNGSSQGTVGSLPANRNTDVIVWNTSALPNGTYSLRSQIDGNSIGAPGVVVVNHSSGIEETTPPVLSVAAPLNGHVFGNTLQVAGFALDNRRVAIVEVLINGVLFDSFVPNEFDKDARDAFPTFPYNSTARFNRIVNTTVITPGNYPFKLRVTDTNGNVTEHNATITKATSGFTPAVIFPTPNESTVRVPDGARRRGKLALKVTRSGNTVSYSVTGVEECSSVRFFASTKGPGVAKVRKRGIVLGEIATLNRDTVTATSVNVLKFKKRRRAPARAGRVYLLADCGEGTTGKVRALDASRLAKPATKNLGAVVESLKNGFSG